jgi:hypothetical protein
MCCATNPRLKQGLNKISYLFDIILISIKIQRINFIGVLDMSSIRVEKISEPKVRYMGENVVLFINSDGSWSIGPNTNKLVKVNLGDIKSITDETFGFSAMAAMANASGGYTLYIRSDADKSVCVSVLVDSKGAVSAESIGVLTNAQEFAVEDILSIDLDGSGGLGDDVEVKLGGDINLCQNPDGTYSFGTTTTNGKNIIINGVPFTDALLPVGWSLVELVDLPNGFDLYADSGTGSLFKASFDLNGNFVSGILLSEEGIASEEKVSGVDLNNDKNLPVSAGWTSVLKDVTFKAAVEATLTASGKMSYDGLVSLMNGIIERHKASNNSPISSNEFDDLKALAARGKSLFADNLESVNATDYLSYVFNAMVDGSVANAFYTGGQTTRTPLGNLAPKTTIANFEKLVNKWLLGGDLPTPSAGGDSATGKASTTVGVYSKTTGSLYENGITPNDVKQGAIGDCFMVAALVAVADVKPNAISEMIISNGANSKTGTQTWGVRLYDDKGKSHWVTVNDMLPVVESGSTSLIFGANPTRNLNGEIWVPLLEKAYAQANTLNILPRDETTGLNAYWAIEGGFGDPLANILGGGKVTAYLYANYSWAQNPYVNPVVIDRNDPAALKNLEDVLTAAVNLGKPIWISSNKSTQDAYGNILLTGGHAFSAQDADKVSGTNVSINVFNPWGISQLPTPPENIGHLSPFPYTVAQLVGFPELDFWILG